MKNKKTKYRPIRGRRFDVTEPDYERTFGEETVSSVGFYVIVFVLYVLIATVAFFV